MKKVLLSATVCVALFMASCSNESDLMNSSVTSSGLMTYKGVCKVSLP